MVDVVFHIPIRDGWHGESWLLETTFDLDFLLDEGDYFHPLKNDEESGLSMEVHRRYWDEHGKVQIQTHTYVIDPPKDLQPLHGGVYRQWNSGTDGDLVGLLMDNGWWAYGKKPESPPPAGVNDVLDKVTMVDIVEVMNKLGVRSQLRSRMIQEIFSFQNGRNNG